MFEKVAPVMTYGGGTSTVVFALNWNEIGVIVGMLIGFAGLALQWYYKFKESRRAEMYRQREDRRAQEAHDLHMLLSKDRPDILGDTREADE